MEPAKIDWKKIESKFVEDIVYEHINAPKWVDFLAPQDSINDESWFCTPDCNHPKTAEDFLKTPSSLKRFNPKTTSPFVSLFTLIDLLKLPSSAHAKEILPLQDRNQRDGKLKRRWLNQLNDDGENQDPNVSTPPISRTKSTKAAIKSSSEKKKVVDDNLKNEELPRLKSTLSARNLFAGKDILGHITEFCNELKKLAMRARERENEKEKASQVGEKNEVETKAEAASCDVLGEVDVRGKERKPLLEVAEEKSCKGMEKTSANEKPRRKKRFEDAENIPISLNMENVKHKGEERLLQIRTNPPSPQCFSVTRAPSKTSPPTPLRSKPLERGILQELQPNKEIMEESADKNKSVPIVNGKEQRSLDVFWFLKPCTLAG